MRYTIFVGGQPHDVDIQRESDRTLLAHLGGRNLTLDVSLVDHRTLSILLHSQSHVYSITELESDKYKVSNRLRTWDAEVKTGSGGAVHAARQSAKKGRVPILSPMPGKVLRISTQEGSRVKAGDCIAIIEAMKMENELKCPKDGQVVKIEAREGDTVDSGDTILVVDDAAP